MSRIKHPRFQPGRTRSLGIEFVDGYAEVDLTESPILKQALLQHGYTVATLTDCGVWVDLPVPHWDLPLVLPAEGERKHVERPGAIVDLTKLKIADLRDIADTEGIDYPAKATRPVLIDLISRVPAEPIQFAVVELPDGTIIGDGKSIATMHEWIVPLEPGEE